MHTIAEIITIIDKAIWGVPLMVAIMGTGIFLSAKLGFLQFRKLGKALKYAVRNESEGEGDVTSFGALCTALAATIGTGNIVGVATAMELGGPGALFWMVVAACFGMATKYSEGVLAIKYREKQADGHILGGPFYYIEKGMGSKWKWLAMCFAGFAALAGALGIGTSTQMNGIAAAAENFFDPTRAHTVSVLGRDVTIATIICTVVVTILVAIVVVGGISRIVSITEKVVPFMAITYFIICVAILAFNFREIPQAIGQVFNGAFGLKAAGGGFVGAMVAAMSSGVARGIFSNEAGLGSAPIAAAAAVTKEPARQGLVSMTGTFIDTIIICNLTGLSILVTHANEGNVHGAVMTARAFGTGLPWGQQVGAFILMACLALFAFTTILGWNYYGERAFEYFTGGNMKAVKIYKVVYIVAVFIGPFVALKTVWAFADILNAMMAIPNLIALIALSGVVVAETKSFFERHSEFATKRHQIEIPDINPVPLQYETIETK